jgi:hypothetical protein
MVLGSESSSTCQCHGNASEYSDVTVGFRKSPYTATISSASAGRQLLVAQLGSSEKRRDIVQSAWMNQSCEASYPSAGAATALNT